jgi:uncharacterized membrane-anchored protein
MQKVVLFLFGALAGLMVGVAGAQEQPERSPRPSLTWQQGPGTVNLGAIAQLRLPGGYSFGDGQVARRFMEATKNIPSGREQGLVLGPDKKWWVLFEFDDIGYVKDDEKNTLDASAMLESKRRGNDASNEERKRRGWSPMTIIGWEQPPRYHPKTHNLEWAIKAESDNHMVINYNTRLLGRKGVMRVTLVGNPSNLQSILPHFNQLLTGFEFSSGNRYAEVLPGDKMAQYGLTALVVGGAATVAAKTGVFKWLWKVLVLIGVGCLFSLKKLFGKKG